MPRLPLNPAIGPMTDAQRHRNMRAHWFQVIEEADNLSQVPFTVLLDAVRRYNRAERNLTLGDVLVEIGRRQGLMGFTSPRHRTDLGRWHRQGMNALFCDDSMRYFGQIVSVLGDNRV